MKGKYIRVLENRFGTRVVIYSRNVHILYEYGSMKEFKRIMPDQISMINDVIMIAYLVNGVYDPTGVASHLGHSWSINVSGIIACLDNDPPSTRYNFQMRTLPGYNLTGVSFQICEICMAIHKYHDRPSCLCYSKCEDCNRETAIGVCAICKYTKCRTQGCDNVVEVNGTSEMCDKCKFDRNSTRFHDVIDRPIAIPMVVRGTR